MRQGSLVKLPESEFWWSKKVGVVTEVRDALFHNGEDWVKHQECKVEFGSDFVWFQTRHLKKINN